MQTDLCVVSQVIDYFLKIFMHLMLYPMKTKEEQSHEALLSSLYLGLILKAPSKSCSRHSKIFIFFFFIFQRKKS